MSRTSNRPLHGYGHLDGLQRYGELLRRGEHVTEGTLRADPHYSLDDGEGAAITADAVVLIDLWARVRDAGDAPYADSTWIAHTGLTPPTDLVRAFAAARAARDAALVAIAAATRAGTPIAGRDQITL